MVPPPCAWEMISLVYTAVFRDAKAANIPDSRVRTGTGISKVITELKLMLTPSGFWTAMPLLIPRVDGDDQSGDFAAGMMIWVLRKKAAELPFDELTSTDHVVGLVVNGEGIAATTLSSEQKFSVGQPLKSMKLSWQADFRGHGHGYGELPGSADFVTTTIKGAIDSKNRKC
ncbi:hypothetical protein OIU76_012703 [Salix suchowensis]|nr:hypothetical protein OIU76_012703 [Salix suchowensis]